MCGRATLTVVDYPTLAHSLGVEASAENAALYKPRWNLAPTDPHWILRLEESGKRVLDPARWGLVNYWAKDTSRAAQQINARAEEVAKKPAYREAYKKRHCLVPVDGFYEWVGPTKRRQPIYFHRADDGVMLLAGLWEDWANHQAPGDRRRTFTVLTRDAKGLNANYHDRMPVIVPRAYQDTWLLTGTTEEPPAWPDYIEPELLAREVSRRANSVKNDDPSILGPPEKETLFD